MHEMARIGLDGGRMKTAEDCYEQFFHAARGLVPDIGDRQNWNLDGLHDDLRDLSERSGDRPAAMADTYRSGQPHPGAAGTGFVRSPGQRRPVVGARTTLGDLLERWFAINDAEWAATTVKSTARSSIASSPWGTGTCLCAS
jgi:hypothetical protein